MTTDEARAILSVYRAESEDADDPFFAEALALAARDETLGRWFASEQKFDAMIAGRLAENPAPPGLKDAALSALEPRNTFEWTWGKAAGLAAIAAVATFLLTLDLVPGRARGGADMVENYRAEMVNFVNMPPPLDMMTPDIEKVRDHLAQNDIAQFDVPGGVAKLPVVGCRSLVFRGYKVGLVCFHHGDGGLAHLLVVNRRAFEGAELPSQPDFHKEGDWMTATWTQGDMLYVLAAKGSKDDLTPLLAALARMLFLA